MRDRISETADWNFTLKEAEKAGHLGGGLTHFNCVRAQRQSRPAVGPTLNLRACPAGAAPSADT